MLNIARRLLREESGQGMAEYGLILALVSVVVIVALSTMGEQIKETFDTITGKIEGANSSTP